MEGKTFQSTFLRYTWIFQQAPEKCIDETKTLLATKYATTKKMTGKMAFWYAVHIC